MAGLINLIDEKKVKTLFCMFGFLLILGGRCSSSSIEEEYFDNGKIKSIVPFKGELINGVVKEYYENGKILGEWNYENGIQNGNYRVFYDNGVLAIEGINIKGEGGACKYYHENGDLALEVDVINGKFEGDAYYYIEGRQWYRATFREGLLLDQEGKFYDGIYRVYYPNGELDLESIFEKGEGAGVYKRYYKNGNLAQVGELENNELAGKVTWYYVNGNISNIYYWKDGAIDGEFLSYSEDGNLEIVANYKKGELAGDFKEYHKNGNLKSEGVCQNGKLEGELNEYFEDGRLWKKYYFHKGDMADEKGELVFGRQESYYQNGVLASTTNYILGKKDGKSKEFFPNGEIKKEGICDSGFCEFKEYDSKGHLRKEYTELDHIQEGRVLEYDDFGTLRLKRYFKNKRPSYVVIYSETGEILYRSGVAF